MLTFIRALLIRLGLAKQGRPSEEAYPVISYKLNSNSLTAALDLLPEAVEQIRPDYFRARGWGRDDSDVTGAQLVDVMGFWSVGTYWLLAVVRLNYGDGDSDLFFLPLADEAVSQHPPRRRRNLAPVAFGTIVEESKPHSASKWVAFDAAYDYDFRRLAPEILSERVRREGYESTGDPLNLYEARYGGTFHFHGPENLGGHGGEITRDDPNVTLITYEPHSPGLTLHLLRKLSPLLEASPKSVAARLDVNTDQVLAWLTYETDTGTEFLLYAVTRS